MNAIPLPENRGASLYEIHPILYRIKEMMKRPDNESVYGSLKVALPTSTYTPHEQDIILAAAAKEVADGKRLTTPPLYFHAVQYYLLATSHILRFNFEEEFVMEIPTFKFNASKLYDFIFRENDPGSNINFILLVSFLNSIGYCIVMLGDTLTAGVSFSHAQSLMT